MWANLLRGLQMAWEASPRSFLATAALSLINALLAPIEVWLGKHLIDLLAAGAPSGITRANLVPSVVALGVLFACNRVLGIYRMHHQELFARRVERTATRRFLAKAASIDIAHFDDPAWHDRSARARREIQWRAFHLTMVSLDTVSSIASLVAMFSLLATVHPLLIGLSLASLLPWILLQRRVNRRIFAFITQETPEHRERDYLATLLAEPDTAKEVRSFGLADHFLGRYTRIVDDILVRQRHLFHRIALMAVVCGVITCAMVIAAYQFVAARGLAGELSIGDFAAALGAFAAVSALAHRMSYQLCELEQQAAFLSDYFAFLGIEPLLPVAVEPRGLPEGLHEGLVVRGVRFTYPRGTREVLTGLDLEVRPGELVAIVGDNGAGKTTIVNLISRFYDPSAGTLHIGGVDLRELDPRDLRSRIGLLLQDFAKYQLTVRDNVQLGRIERTVGDDAILDSLASARASSLVGGLANGLDSRIGRMFDGGHELSGGEWQRLAIARLIFRRADLWILDEPTSNLDPEAEARIFSELKQQLAGRMAIVISHRFSTVRAADRIYVIEAGRVLESGTHDQLLAERGRYAELFELQAAGYR